MRIVSISWWDVKCKPKPRFVANAPPTPACALPHTERDFSRFHIELKSGSNLLCLLRGASITIFLLTLDGYLWQISPLHLEGNYYGLDRKTIAE